MALRFTCFWVAVGLASQWRLCAQDILPPGPGESRAYVREEGQVIRAGNDRIELTFSKGDGRLQSIVERPSLVDFITAKDAHWGPFNLLMDVDGKDQYLLGVMAGSFSYEVLSGKDQRSLALTWRQFRPGPGITLDVQVRITVDIPDSGGLTYWRIAVLNNENRVIRQVAFPAVNGIGQLSSDGKNDYLACPGMSGLLFRDPVNNINLNNGYGWGLHYPSAYSNMQFMAYYSNEARSGLYVATQDTRGSSKFINAGKSAQDWMSVVVSHPRPVKPGLGFEPDYAAVVGVFSGDWFDAAAIYRSWAQQQEWFRNASLQRPEGVPEWFRTLPLHQWDHTYLNCQNSNTFANVPGASKAISERMGAPVAMDWVGWERFGWYIDYPDVFPPKEGWASFDSTVARVQDLGNRVWVVPDTTGHSSRVQSWAQAKPEAIVDAQGNYPFPVNYTECGEKTAFYQICPASAYWQSQLRSLIGELAGHQVDIIQLDGFPVVPAPPCYATTHGHLPGAADMYAPAYRALFESIKADARIVNPKVQISSEGMAEYYLGFLDSVSDPFTTGWSPSSFAGSVSDVSKIELIPLWHTVYHDATLIHSGISLFRRQTPTGESAESERRYYARGLARALVWGEAATFAADRGLPALNTAQELALLEYMKRIVQARHEYASAYLTTGRMLRAPRIDVPTIDLPGAVDIPYTGAVYPPSVSPAVLASLWRAPNGYAGYVFTNISDDKVEFELVIDAKETGLDAEGKYEVFEVRNGERSLLLDEAWLPAVLSVAINPMDALLIEVGRQTPGDGAYSSGRNVGVAPQ